MDDLTILVLRSDEPNDIQELTTVNLPGVPRVVNSVNAEGETFEVQRVRWAELLVQLTVKSERYG